MSTIARTLRRDATEAEKRVRHAWRAHQAGAKFRRQQPIEGYVVDHRSASRAHHCSSSLAGEEGARRAATGR
ncbi:MAG TPA: DUF559 domain-containing protein [Stellaceae bacterium]|nr:DUF559 domain-containing protein [Stellaceae bacterium]